MGIGDNLRYKIRMATVVEKLIGVNVLVFVLFFLFRTIAFLFQLPSDFLVAMVCFSEGNRRVYL